MDTKSCALPGLLAALLVGLVLLLSSVQPGAAERAVSPALDSAVADTQHIHLTEGWNFVGARVTPDATDFDLLFEDVADVPLVSDGNGGMYYPVENLNTTGAWNTQRGYFVYAEGPETLVLEGASLSSETVISLESGWNLAPYLLQDPIGPEEAFAGIADKLLIAKDDEGRVFIPESGINEIGALRPGRAYQLFVSEPVDLTYASSSPPDEFVYDSECEAESGAHLLHTFGPLHEGERNINIEADSLQIVENTNTINGALDEIGSDGGGILCLPKGRFETAALGAVDPAKGSRTAIQITHNNLTLWGAGRNDDGNGTGLYTNGTWWVVEGSVRRGHGMQLYNPINNITLRDFELNGQGALPGDSTAWTGDNSWPANPTTGDGWDISHKGLVVSWGGSLDADNILVERVAVRSYKGEVLYQGGRGLVNATFRDIISEDTNAQAFNVHGANVLVEDSYFGLSTQWAELDGHWEGRSGTFINNIWENCSRNNCITAAQGDGSIIPMHFENNTFRNCNFNGSTSGHAFGFGEGVAGPYTVQNNIFKSCGLGSGISGGTTGATPENITFENNTLTDLESAQGFHFSRGINSVTIRNNYFEWVAGKSGPAFRLGWQGYLNGLVENNTFVNEQRPNQGGTIRGPFPLSRNNSFSQDSFDSGLGTIYASDPRILVTHEERRIRRGHEHEEFIATFYDVAFPDGMEVFIFCDVTCPVVFEPGDSMYEVSERVEVEGGRQGTTLTMSYDANQGKWIEVDESE